MSGRDFQAASFLAIVNAFYIMNMTDEKCFHYVILVVRSLIIRRTANHTSFPTSSKPTRASSISKELNQMDFSKSFYQERYCIYHPFHFFVSLSNEFYRHVVMLCRIARCTFRS